MFVPEMMMTNQILTLNKSFKKCIEIFGNVQNFSDLYYVIKMITNKQKTKVMKNEMELVLEMLETRFNKHLNDMLELQKKVDAGEDDDDDHDEMIYLESAYQEVEIIIDFIKTFNQQCKSKILINLFI